MFKCTQIKDGIQYVETHIFLSVIDVVQRPVDDIPRRCGACGRMHALRHPPRFLCGNGRRLLVLLVTAALLMSGVLLSVRWYQGTVMVDHEGEMETVGITKASPDGTIRVEGNASQPGKYTHTTINGRLVIIDCALYFLWLAVVRP